MTIILAGECGDDGDASSGRALSRFIVLMLVLALKTPPKFTSIHK